MARAAPVLPRSTLWLTLLLAGCAVAPPMADREASDQAAPAIVAPGSDAVGGEDAAGFLYDARTSEPPLAESPLPPEAYEDLWRRIAAGLKLRCHYAHPAVAAQVRRFKSRPEFFQRAGERARPFLHAIALQIEQRDLPMEIALIPFVESDFKTNATSTMAAVGPWQFMEGTGRGLGLRVDEWFDGRRDPILATRAALDYLEALAKQFDGDWLMAFAAYNSGPGTVGRLTRAATAAGAEADFWNLPLPTETEIHVPRILALASLLAEHGGDAPVFPAIANEEVLRHVELDDGASILSAAELAGVEPDAARELNPGYRQWWTPPDGGPHPLHLPIKNAESLALALRRDPGAVAVDDIRYRIQPGDTLGGIARAMSVPLSLLRSRNGLDGDLIIAGKTLLIPRQFAPSTERWQP